ncbi:MAG: PD40 domain-containing protein [Phycisphaeraceae bacterium]|nr:PD40 domain-containing protein [Phycisphaeraceae bacterium]
MKKASSSSIKGLVFGIIVCLLFATQVARADLIFGEPEMVPNVNSTFYDGGPQISRNGLELYMVSARDGGVKKIWVSKRATTEDPWSIPTKLGALADSNASQDFPSPSADGLELYFREVGSRAIWVLTRVGKDDPWGVPENLGPIVNSADWNNWHPCISADGLSLYIASAKGDSWLSEIRVTTRLSTNDPWVEPVKLGTNVNSHDYETTPFISPDGLSLFFSRGYDQADVYVSRRVSTTEPWGPAELFTPVNSGEAEFRVSFSNDDSTIYFSRAGEFFANDDFNIWQVEVTPIMDLNGDGAVDTLDVSELQEHLGSTDPLYDIAPLPLGDGISNDKDLRALKEHLSLIATDPYPISKANEISRDVALSWKPIESAKSYDLYLGDDYDDVKDATTADSSYMGQQTVASYDPGRLEFGKTYYWRVDEANSVPDFSVFKGNVWSFTTESNLIQIPGSTINATASSSEDEFSTPSRTIDGSGLDDPTDKNALHSNYIEDAMWMSASPDLSPWLMYEFEHVQKFGQMLTWNFNHPSEAVIGWGVKDVDIQVSMDGVDWTSIPDVGPIAQGPGLVPIEAHTIDMGLTTAKYVRLNILSNWGGFLPQYGVSEVQFYSLPTKARTPVPASGSTDVAPDTLLSWRAGREAIQHIIYVSTDQNEVADGLANSLTSSTNSLDLSSLDLQMGETYYWRVDEVNEAEVPSVWTGPVWSFHIVGSVTLDDFESYSKFSPDRPFQTWLDGSGYSSDEFFPVAYEGNGTGSSMGHDVWNTSSPHFGGSIMERAITRLGSRQSMPFYYNNTGAAASQTDRTWSAPQDWTIGAAETLVLYFYGSEDNTGDAVFVKINGQKVTYPDNANLSRAMWHPWIVDLASLGINLSAVTSMSIGVEGAGSGMILIDDMHLYRNAPAIVAGLSTYGFDDIPDSTGVNGKHNGIDFGTDSWWGGDSWYGLTKVVYFYDNYVNRDMSFILPADTHLVSIAMSADGAYSYTISDGVNADITGTTSTTPQVISTQWTSGGQTITISTAGGWFVVFDDITYQISN